MLISVIIRTKNEQKYLRQVLDAVSGQTFKDFEIIIVDDNSTDETLDIAKNYNCEVVSISQGKFSHPYSCNLGAKNAEGKFLVYLNGHSVLTSKTAFEDVLKNFEDENVAGVYSQTISHEGSTFADKILNDINGYTIGMLRFKVKKPVPGLLATMSSVIRKDLWEIYNFDEDFNQGFGGEDTDWASHFIERGYYIIHDPKFKVRHSHNLQMKDLIWQLRNWKKMNNNSEIPERQRRNF